MIEAREFRLDPSALVQPGRTLERCWEALSANRSPVLVVEDSDHRTAVLASRIRTALQDQVDPLMPVGRLACDRLVVRSREAARLRLTADRSLSAVVLDDPGGPFVFERELPIIREAVVMAGGFGTRLKPLTDQTPKPLLEVGGRPLLCRILDGLRDAGVQRVHVSVHYLADRVRKVVGDGSEWQLRVSYLEEREPLGTGAGLALLHGVDEPFFIVNGDVLTDVDLHAFARHHQLGAHLATVATYLYSAPLPYGVVHQEGGRIRRIEEKPVYRYPVNAGLYVFDARVLELVEHGRPLAMVDFLNAQAVRHSVGCFPLVEYWNDVGSHADYERAQLDVRTLRAMPR